MATAVNAKAQPQGPAVAIAIDERTVRVEIPDAEMTDRAAFLADVLSAEVNPSLLDLPAQVIVNTRSGSIIVTGDVTIAPVAFTTRDLSITTVRPAPTPTAQAPLVERSRWADLQTGARPSEQTRLTTCSRLSSTSTSPSRSRSTSSRCCTRPGNCRHASSSTDTP